MFALYYPDVVAEESRSYFDLTWGRRVQQAVDVAHVQRLATVLEDVHGWVAPSYAFHLNRQTTPWFSFRTDIPKDHTFRDKDGFPRRTVSTNAAGCFAIPEEHSAMVPKSGTSIGAA